MQKIGNIFSEIQEGANVSNTNIYNLIDEFQKNPTNLINGLEQCYLKILKMGSKANKKPVEKFEKVTEKLFHLMLQEANDTKSKKKIDIDDVYGLVQHFLNFLSNGFDSSNTHIRAISAKHISLMLKVFSSQDLEDILDEKVIEKLLDGTISLLKSKHTNLKLLALKISSYIQKFSSDELKTEILNCMANDESRDVRKVAMINLQSDESSLPYLLIRTREMDSEIRHIVFAKLRREKVPLANLRLCDIYKIVYDGLYAREEGVREACMKYLRANYDMFSDNPVQEPEAHLESEEEEEDDDKIVDEEDEEEAGEGKRERKAKKRGRKKRSVDKKAMYNKVKLEIRRFLNIFQIEKTLVYPHLYDLVETVCEYLINDIIFIDELQIYVREFIKVDCKQNQFKKIDPEELFFFRVLCNFVQNNSREYSEIINILDDNFVSLNELAKIIENNLDSSSLFNLYQLFLLAEMGMNMDETGRQALITVAKAFCLDVVNTRELDLSDLQGLPDYEFNDILPKKSADEISLQQFSQSFFDTPIIRDSNDLVSIVVGILRKMLDDRNYAYSNFVLETIAELKDTIERDVDDNRNELLSQKQQFEDRIIQVDKNLKALELEGGKKKGKQDPEKERKKLLEDKKKFEEKVVSIEEQIVLTNIRCLHIACALLQTCRISTGDPGITGLLSSFIGPCFSSENPAIKDLSFKCLSLYVLLDKKFCVEYMKIYKEYLDNFKPGNACEPSLLITIKAIFDFFLAYNLLNEEGLFFEAQEGDNFDGQDLVDRLLNIMFNGDIITKKVCVEGFTRLIFNKRVKNPVDISTLLMLIWYDTMLSHKGGSEIIQILTTFFRTFSSYSQDGLGMFEKTFENFLTLLVTLSESKEYEFNTDMLTYNLTEDFIVNTVGNIGSSLLTAKPDDRLDGPDGEVRLSPVQRYFLFLCEVSSEGDMGSRVFKKIFEKTVTVFPLDNLTPTTKGVLFRYTEHFLSQNSDSSQVFKNLEKKLRPEEETEDESQIEKVMKNLEEDRLQSRNEFRSFLKSLKEKDIIAKKTFNWYADEERKWNERKKRITADSDEDDDDLDVKAPATISRKPARKAKDDDSDEIKITSRSKGRKGGARTSNKTKGAKKRKAPSKTPANDDESESDKDSLEDSEQVRNMQFSSLKERLKRKLEEIESAEKEMKAKSASSKKGGKRGATKKEEPSEEPTPEKKEETEESEDEEEEEEEEKTPKGKGRGRSSGGKAKGGKSKTPSSAKGKKGTSSSAKGKASSRTTRGSTRTHQDTKKVKKSKK